jgi:cyclophilin family peptidyl-prolyl cis-trans isomerase
VVYLLVGVATCVLGLAALVVHTRALTAAHLEVAHQFSVFEQPQQRNKRAVAAPPASLCAPDSVAGVVGEPHSELWGDVVVSGAGAGTTAGHSAPSAAACCEACESTRGCNVWVWCAEAASCGQQCWLKRVGDPSAAAIHNRGAGVPWHSGALAKDGDVKPGSLPPPDESIKGVVIATPKGNIRLKLRPDWSESSVAFVRLLAAHPLSTPAFEFYRVEPGFLLQGSLRALIPSNNITTKGPRAMQRGDVGWAGAGPGPDFFIYLGSQPATHWGTDHTVWAEVADEASLAMADAIAALPPLPTKPGEMHMIAERVKIDVRRDRAALL